MGTMKSLAAALLVAAADAATLRAAGAAAGVFMGSQFKYSSIFNATAGAGIYRATHSQEYGLSTVGNMCKWGAVQPHRGNYTFERCQASLRYAQSAGQKFRGHNLCWGNNNPPWLLAITDPDELREVLRGHINATLRAVDGAYAWDVVNEAVSEGKQWLKPSPPWYPAVPDYIDVAFRAARAAAPDALLFYNDFRAEEMGTVKSDNVYNMVKSMVARGVPIDGVGLQMHLKVAPNATKIGENIARLGALGLQVHITEMDVICADPCPPAALEAQAQVYADVLRVCLEHKKTCRSFETWGFTDAVTWLTGDRCATGNCHPLPYDESYNAKPAVAAMLKVLAEFAE